MGTCIKSDGMGSDLVNGQYGLTKAKRVSEEFGGYRMDLNLKKTVNEQIIMLCDLLLFQVKVSKVK